ncbi:hypothetical protein L6164_008116 [Bauhinia variegata]|uniref:Uncharacterized protein n=1 Tax=Bauhinia variegata TaxID=167791 RepID=A0ACB9PEL3_BAUVA|nr:hypothetical protein L6164_008116 [Bauhinia variegata]
MWRLDHGTVYHEAVVVAQISGAPVTSSLNHWSVLDQEPSLSSSAATVRTEVPGKKATCTGFSKLESNPEGQLGGKLDETSF